MWRLYLTNRTPPCPFASLLARQVLTVKFFFLCFTMADDSPATPTTGGDDEFGENDGYKVAAQVDLETLKNLDNDDEALNRWKEQLLADSQVVESDDPRNVIVDTMEVHFDDEGRDPLIFELDTDEGVDAIKEATIIIKENATYRIKVTFRVLREAVLGLKYGQNVYRRGVRVDKSITMIGSYAPKADVIEHTFPDEVAPSGMIARGHYTAKSKFTDDDGNDYLAWEWSFDIKKKWGDE